MHDPCKFDVEHKANFDAMHEDIRRIREKLYNGLSDLPGELKWLRNLLLGILISLVLSIGGTSAWIMSNVHETRGLLQEAKRLVVEIQGLFEDNRDEGL